jgi:hypothetical protein
MFFVIIVIPLESKLILPFGTKCSTNWSYTQINNIGRNMYVIGERKPK